MSSLVVFIDHLDVLCEDAKPVRVLCLALVLLAVLGLELGEQDPGVGVFGGGGNGRNEAGADQ